MISMKKQLGLALLFLMWQVAPLCAQPPLTLNTFAGPPLSTPDHTGYYDRILLEAFSRLQVPITIGHLAAERSLQNADRGIDDGDFARVAGLEERYANLLMVPEKLDDFEFVAFARTINLSTSSWSALKPYHVGIVRGWKILEQNLAGVKKLLAVKDQEQLFNLLKNGRADVVVYSRKEGCVLIRQLGIADAHVLEPPLAVRPMHLYLNRKHAEIVAPLATVLKLMKEDGTFAAIARQALAVPFPEEDLGACP
jgi:polar amino acid transport system substrate-binding protein